MISFQIKKELQTRSYQQFFNQLKDLPIPIENLTEEENKEIKFFANEEQIARELAEAIEEKIENEKKEQEEFLETIKTQIFEEHLIEIEGCHELTRLLQQKVYSKYALGLRAMVEPDK